MIDKVLILWFIFMIIQISSTKLVHIVYMMILFWIFCKFELPCKGTNTKNHSHRTGIIRSYPFWGYQTIQVHSNFARDFPYTYNSASVGLEYNDPCQRHLFVFFCCLVGCSERFSHERWKNMNGSMVYRRYTNFFPTLWLHWNFYQNTWMNFQLHQLQLPSLKLTYIYIYVYISPEKWMVGRWVRPFLFSDGPANCQWNFQRLPILGPLSHTIPISLP